MWCEMCDNNDNNTITTPNSPRVVFHCTALRRLLVTFQKKRIPEHLRTLPRVRRFLTQKHFIFLDCCCVCCRRRTWRCQANPNPFISRGLYELLFFDHSYYERDFVRWKLWGPQRRSNKRANEHSQEKNRIVNYDQFACAVQLNSTTHTDSNNLRKMKRPPHFSSKFHFMLLASTKAEKPDTRL